MNTKKLKLKGRNSKRLKKAKKQVMQKTLNIMQKNRQIDSDNLRDLIEQKLKWAEAEKTKGLKQIEQFKIQVYKLEGILLFIKDILEPKE